MDSEQFISELFHGFVPSYTLANDLAQMSYSEMVWPVFPIWSAKCQRKSSAYVCKYWI